jgi:hypothetical protein
MVDTLLYIRRILNKIIHRQIVKDVKEIHFHEFERNLCNNLEIVLVCSTGRCGTKFFSELCGKNLKNIDCEHKPYPEFAYNQNYLFHGAAAAESRYFLVGRMESLSYAYFQNKTYVEVSTKSTVLLKEIIATFPKLKVIHLWRDPREFVQSSMSRGYYKNTKISESRIYPSKGRKWKNDYSQLEKCYWNWLETNRFILENSANLDLSRLLSVNSSSMFKSVKVMRDMLEFVNDDKIDHEIITPKKVNSNARPFSGPVDCKNEELMTAVNQLSNFLVDRSL